MIRQLAEQCCSNKDEMNIDQFDYIKFSQLIIEKCNQNLETLFVGAVGSHSSAHNSAIKKCIEELKNQFTN